MLNAHLYFSFSGALTVVIWSFSSFVLPHLMKFVIPRHHPSLGLLPWTLLRGEPDIFCAEILKLSLLFSLSKLRLH